MKRVLVVYFSQTGQLQRAAESLAGPLAAAGDIEVDWIALEPETPYPFPWPFLDFFDQFPESVQLDPAPNKPVRLEKKHEYDLVILAYTVWFLSPAPPVTAFLKSGVAAQLLKNRPVVTLIACRNMWISADQTVRQLLADIGARHMDHAVLVDRGPALATFVTTPRWMLTGRKGAFWGMFPAAGISGEDIAAASRFGHALVQRLQSESPIDASRPALTGLGAVDVDTRLLASERIGQRSFQIWSRLLRRCGRPGTPLRRVMLVIYSAFLVTMIVTVVPVTMLIRAILRPLTAVKMQKLKSALEQPSGSSRERMTSTTGSLQR